MIYEYECYECEKRFDVVKSHTRMNDPEDCVFCNSEKTKRQFPPSKMKIELCRTQVEHPYYSPALGKVVQSTQHLRSEAKARGWEEVGTESPDKIHKAYDNEREKKIQTRYDDLI